MEEKKTILLVEDNLQDELLTIRALKQNGIRHDIVVCRDGLEALDWLLFRGDFKNRDQSQNPAVILLDLKLPKLDGHQVLSAIRADRQLKFLPVVILTTSKEESDVLKSYENGANSYIQKPVNFDDFSKAIRNLGIYWLLMNESTSASKYSSQENVGVLSD
jgi:CheY-like chemotaxis protein